MPFKYKERLQPNSLISVMFRCDDCGFEVTELRERNSTEPSPECPHCEAMADTPMTGPVPATTAIGERRASRAVDSMWKAEEEGSAIRAEALGDPSMKITDMKDGFYGGGLKEGDSTAPTVPRNPVTEYAAMTNFNGGKFWGQGGQQGTTLESVMTKAAAGKRAAGTGGIQAINAIQGNSGPLQFPARQRPQNPER